jgi:ABC-type nitrate/sulfonate/bicarbonate transport system ATPase subunit
MNTYPNNIKLELKNIKKSFEENRIIEDISLKLYENEFVSLLGLSGSGKSTIFNIISGLIPPDEGEVIIQGVNFTGKTGRVSYMYQKDLLLPWRKVIDNVCLPLLLKGDKKEHARMNAQSYFKAFGLEGYEYKYPFQLSGGMRQRAALLRTYLFSSDIMLLDEPFGGLDAITRSKMHYWLLEVLQSINATVLFITHDIDESLLLSDRMYILTDKPARIKEEILVNLPKPRTRDISTSKEFNDLKRNILNILE